MGARNRPGHRSPAAIVAAAVLGLAVIPLAGIAQAQTAAPEQPVVAGTPCTATARACVDLAGQNAWLISDGKITRGPVKIRSGGDGQATPTGTFAVEWKDKNHRSKEFNNAPMPYSVFFAPGGIAFHEGTLQRASAGCVRLARDDAVAFYDTLQVGDEVQVR